MHGLCKIDRIKNLEPVPFLIKGSTHLIHKSAFRERSVKIENGKVTNNFQFRNLLFLHHHASVASSYPPECPCSSC